MNQFKISIRCLFLTIIFILLFGSGSFNISITTITNSKYDIFQILKKAKVKITSPTILVITLLLIDAVV